MTCDNCASPIARDTEEIHIRIKTLQGASRFVLCSFTCVVKWAMRRWYEGQR